MAPASTAMALPFTATVLRTTATVLDITAIGVAALTTRIACQLVPERGGEQWIEQIAGAMSAAAVAGENWACSATSIGTLRRGSDPVGNRRHGRALTRRPTGSAGAGRPRPGW